MPPLPNLGRSLLRTMALCAPLLLALSGASFAQEDQDPRVLPTLTTEEEIQSWIDFIAPRKSEEEWREIPWRSQLHEALLEAKANDKPVLLWAMNGHPLGCV